METDVKYPLDMTTNFFEMSWEALRDVHAVKDGEQTDYVGTQKPFWSNGVEVSFKKADKELVTRFVEGVILDVTELTDGGKCMETLYYHGQDNPYANEYEALAKKIIL